MKYFLCLIVLVGCAESKVLKYKTGDVVETKLGEIGLITFTNHHSWAVYPYTLDIKGANKKVEYKEDFIVKVIENDR